jgi:hypothetical protein
LKSLGFISLPPDRLLRVATSLDGEGPANAGAAPQIDCGKSAEGARLTHR